MGSAAAGVGSKRDVSTPLRVLRPGLVWTHRWVGLVMALFLLLEGLTGSLLAFKRPIDETLNPQLYAQPRPGTARLDLATLALKAEAAQPGAQIGYFWIEDRQAIFHMGPRRDVRTGAPATIDFNVLILDPWTGAELGRYRHADLSQGKVNLIPFVFELHASLAPIPLGGTGGLILGIVALAWTLDCFVGFYLTLPVTLARFLARWRPSWQVKWPAGFYRVNFDLHRAGGLWLWPLLFVLAWSSVMFTLRESVYEPVMGVLFDFRSMDEELDAMSSGRHPGPPAMGWKQAQEAGEHRMGEMAARHGFAVEGPYGMAYLSDWNVYAYDVVASVNVQGRGWNTGLWLDGDSGALVREFLPSGEHSGNTVETWLRALHFADLRDSASYRWLVFLTGLVIAELSVTGTYIWWKKRRAAASRGARPPR